jgi:hypothetical protein
MVMWLLHETMEYCHTTNLAAYNIVYLMCPQRMIFPALEALYREFKVLFHKRSPPWRRWTVYPAFYQRFLLGSFAFNTTSPAVNETGAN